MLKPNQSMDSNKHRYVGEKPLIWGGSLIWGTEIFLIRKCCRLWAVCGTFRAPHATFVYVIFITGGAAFCKPVRSLCFLLRHKFCKAL
jgi:hypothetical protein